METFIQRPAHLCPAFWPHPIPTFFLKRKGRCLITSHRGAR